MSLPFGVTRRRLPMKRKKDVFVKPTKQKEISEIRKNYELLLPQTEGYIEPDLNEKTYQISQEEIVSSVDITSATKHFGIKLNYGPYCINYFRNGRQLLVGGERGHVAALDWVTKRLICEFNVMESVSDVKWLHMPTLFAVAQKDWVHIYDEKGTEMHCLKKLYQIRKMEFLPFHFLLVAASDQGFLSWTDTSCGKLVCQFRPKKVRKIMGLTQNPSNGVIITGYSNGVVNMWTPNSQEPVVQMLCHSGALRDVDVTIDGTRMVTLGVDRKCKLWDIRMLRPLHSYYLNSIGECVSVSQQDLVSIGTGNVVQILGKNCWSEPVKEPYMRHRISGFVKNLQFCNFEDVLGIGQEDGFSSILVPGSGEPNFDTFESNPFMTKSQRKEMEVKMLLDKIPAELINIDPDILGKVNIKELVEAVEAKRKLGYVKVPKIKFKEKKSMKSVDKFKLKKRLRDEAVNRQVKSIKKSEIRMAGQSKMPNGTNRKISYGLRKKSKGVRAVNRFLVQKGLKKKAVKKSTKEVKKDFASVLDRFKPKNK